LDLSERLLRRRASASPTLANLINEDLWVPIAPNTEAALAGANSLVNLSTSNVTIGKPDYRRLLGAAQSAKCVAACLYSGAGPGESTTDLAWDGHAPSMRMAISYRKARAIRQHHASSPLTSTWTGCDRVRLGGYCHVPTSPNWPTIMPDARDGRISRRACELNWPDDPSSIRTVKQTMRAVLP
jgi:hypothetical protein